MSEQFDVFLCHNSQDKPEVREIARQLQQQGLKPWLDEWELRPGLSWQELLEEQIEDIKAAAVFVGRSGFGPWQEREMRAFLSEFVNRNCPVIPVLLETAPDRPSLPIFLRAMTWVDFRQSESNPMGRLIWGINGNKPDDNPNPPTVLILQRSINYLTTTTSRRKLLKYGGFILGGMLGVALLARILKPRSKKIELVKNIQVASGSEIWSLAISPDGEFIASGKNTGTIEIFNRQTGDFPKILDEHQNVTRALVFMPQTHQLISGDGDGNIKIHQQNNNLPQKLQGHSASIWSLAISPDGETLVSCSEDESIRVWNLKTGEVDSIIFSHDAVVYAVAFSPDGKVFASAGKDKKIKIWNAKDRTLLRSFLGHQDAVRAIAISPDGRYLISGSWDKTVKVWKLDTGNLITTFSGHVNRVVSVAIGNDSDTVFSGSTDNTIRVWSIKKNQLITTIWQHHDWILALATSQQENLLVSGSKDSTIKLWQY